MTSQKLPSMLRIITNNLSENEIPYTLIGAFALNLYGLPMFTADIDLLTEGRFWPMISPVMERLGYTCFHKTKSFAQFDCELGVYGKVDFMFVNTPEGRDILVRSIVIKDELLGEHSIIQPTDYIILKLMAIANNPDRSSKDEGDIIEVLKLSKNGLIPEDFDILNRDRIYFFAERFGLRKRAKSLLDKAYSDPGTSGTFEL